MKLAKKKELTDVTKWMKVTGANELDIPYIGYVEVQVEVANQKIAGVGVLVVKDPTDQYGISRKEKVPGILGSKFFEIMRNTTGLGKTAMPMAESPEWLRILSV